MRWKKPAQAPTSERAASFVKTCLPLGCWEHPYWGAGGTRIRFPLEENGMPTVWREGALS